MQTPQEASAPLFMALRTEQYDKTDRMLHPGYFHMLERKIGYPFTLDACSNPTGDNALCARFCSLKNSFLKYDCSGESVWINPPFTPSVMKAMLRHYLYCKLKEPHQTSACILLPDWLFHPYNLISKACLLSTLFHHTQQ